MDRAARLLRGTLRVRVESAFPERVLNLCGAHGIAFSDLRWESASALSFTVRAAERKKLERLLAPLDAALTVERAEGAPFFLRRFRRRYTLLAGLALMLALFFANSFFIWDFEVSGSERPDGKDPARAGLSGCAAAALLTPSARRTSANRPRRSYPSLRG